jgi:hypothetical protein
MRSREQELEQNYPTIAWREPQETEVFGGRKGYLCRFCIAMHGFKARSDQSQIRTYDEVARHIAEAHR